MTASLQFFNVTPLGELVNCLSKDQDAVDESLPDVFHISVVYLMILLTTLILVCVTLPIYAVVAAILFVAFMVLFTAYMRAVRELKKLSGILPLLSLMFA
jgi:ABC-type multidrug transport system fused ATPase/permease subunit